MEETPEMAKTVPTIRVERMALAPTAGLTTRAVMAVPAGIWSGTLVLKAVHGGVAASADSDGDQGALAEDRRLPFTSGIPAPCSRTASSLQVMAAVAEVAPEDTASVSTGSEIFAKTPNL